MEQTSEREANSAILDQTGSPPPRSVLATLMQLSPHCTPQHVTALVTRGDTSTTWRIVALVGASLVEVVGTKASPNWQGGSFRDDGDREEVAARLHPLRGVTSVRYDLRRRFNDFAGLSTFTIGVWTIAIEGAAEDFVLDEQDAHGEHTGPALRGLVQAVLASC